MRDWVRSIVNHLYWTAATSKSGNETVAKWISIANHVQNVHHHEDSHFEACVHEPIGNNTRKWLKPSKYISIQIERPAIDCLLNCIILY